MEYTIDQWYLTIAPWHTGMLQVPLQCTAIMKYVEVHKILN
jgi:hypothetical protein